jgi:WD40 repeat protein/Tfp pilus assembly protein PilF
MQTTTLAKARTSLCDPRLLCVAAACLLSSADRDLRAQAQSPPPSPADARTHAQAYFEDDKPRRAVAILAEAARKNPEDRVLGSMLYAGIRDHVWHLQQVRPVKHSGEVKALTFSDDGKSFATGSTTGELWISPTEPKQEKDAADSPIALPKAESEITGLAFSKDGARLAAVSKVEGLRVWDVAAKKTSFEVPRPAQPVTAFASAAPRERVAFGTAEGKIVVADIAACKIIAELEQSGGPIRDLAFSQNAQRLAAACHGGVTRVWDLETGKPIGGEIRQKGSVLTVDFPWDDAYVITGGDDKKVHLWKLPDGTEPIPAADCKTTVLKVRLSPEGSRVAAMLDDGSVKFYDAVKATELPYEVREDQKFNDISWSRTGLRIATAANGNQATIWSARDGNRWGEIMNHESPVLTIAYSVDGKLLGTGSADGNARIWRMDGGKAMPTVRTHHARARSAFYSIDGKHIVTTSEDHTALHWISGQVRPAGPALRHKGKVTCGSFNENATRLLTSDDSGVVQLWDIATHKPVGEPFKHKDAVEWVDFHPDGKRFVTASDAGASVWSVDNRAKPLTVITHPGKEKNEIKYARFSHNGKWLATASMDGTARIWDAETFKPVTDPIKRGYPVLCARFSLDSSRLVVGGEDGQAAVYDTATWKPVGTPVLLPGAIFSAAITEDNRFLVVASFLLNAVQFFDIETGRPLGPGLNLPSQPTGVDYNLPEKNVIVACDDGTVRAYGTPFVDQDVPSWACDFAERLVGYRQTGPDEFVHVDTDLNELAGYRTIASASREQDFAKLVGWKMTMGNERTGMPRFLSKLADNIDRRVEERSLDALYECVEAAPVDDLVYGALSVYSENPRQSEFLADMVLSHKNASPLARAFAASALVNAGRTDEAQKILADAVATAPDDPRVLRREAKLNARLMNEKLCIEQFEKALSLEPNNFETHRTYGWALLHFNRAAEAATHFHAAQDLVGDMVDDLVAGICLSAAAQKNNAEAFAAYRRLIELDPVWKDAAYLTSLRGWTPRELKDLERVRQNLLAQK